MDPGPSKKHLVVVDVSSDEGSPLAMPNGDFDWLEELLSEDDDRGLAAAGSDDVVVVSESNISPNVTSERNVEDDDDEVILLEGDPDKPASAPGDRVNNGQDSDDLLVVGEKGQVACRDYPHPRHDCVIFPFSTTPHEKHCDLCHCYVCDSPAPCTYWGTGVSDSDHCHANNKDGGWKILRNDFKHGKIAGQKQNAFSNVYGTPSTVVPLPNQTLHYGNLLSPANLFPQNHESQQVMTGQSCQTVLRGNTAMPTHLVPENLPLRHAVTNPSSETLLHGNTSSMVNLMPTNVLVKPPILRRCSSSVSSGASDNFYHWQQQSGDLQIDLQPLFAQTMLSHGINVTRSGGGYVSGNLRPLHASSLPRFKKTGTVHRPLASRAGCASNHLNGAMEMQCSKLLECTLATEGHNHTLRQSSLPSFNYISDTWSSQLNDIGVSTMTVPSQSPGFCHSNGDNSVDAQNVNPMYQQVQNSTAVDLSDVTSPSGMDHVYHQSQGDSFQPVAESIEAGALPQQYQPLQPPNRQSAEDFNLRNAGIDNNWWSENELSQGQFLLEPDDVVDTSMLLLDYETPWNGVTQS